MTPYIPISQQITQETLFFSPLLFIFGSTLSYISTFSLHHLYSLSYSLRFCLLQHYRYSYFLQIWPLYWLKSQDRVYDQLDNLTLSHTVTGYWASLQNSGVLITINIPFSIHLYMYLLKISLLY